MGGIGAECGTEFDVPKSVETEEDTDVDLAESLLDWIGRTEIGIEIIIIEYVCFHRSARKKVLLVSDVRC